MAQRDEDFEPDPEVRTPIYERATGENASPPAAAPMPNLVAPEPLRGRPVLLPAVLAGVLLLIAVAPLEYGFYTALRIAVTAAAIWVAVAAVRSRQVGWAVVAAALAILFNPLIPVWLSKGVWIPIDLVGAALMIFAGVFVRSKPTE
jgi:lysylphosphatidylglycerol synthetase-like protein (DUF2156 family)